MINLGGNFNTQSDKKYVCSFLHTVDSEDIFLVNKIKRPLQLLIRLFVELDVIWITSDNRIKLTSKGSSALQDLLISFVDFEPKSVKFYYTKYE